MTAPPPLSHRPALALVLLIAAAFGPLTAAACGPAQFGDMGPNNLVIADDGCGSDADCGIFDLDTDPCNCHCGYQAANKAWATRWLKDHSPAERPSCDKQCKPCDKQPEHALCVVGRCVAAKEGDLPGVRAHLCPPEPEPAQSSAPAQSPGLRR